MQSRRQQKTLKPVSGTYSIGETILELPELPSLPAHRLITSKCFLRSTLSASAPAGRVKRKNGSEAMVDISDSKKGDTPSVFSSRSSRCHGPPRRYRRPGLRSRGF